MKEVRQKINKADHAKVKLHVNIKPAYKRKKDNASQKPGYSEKKKESESRQLLLAVHTSIIFHASGTHTRIPALSFPVHFLGTF